MSSNIGTDRALFLGVRREAQRGAQEAQRGARLRRGAQGCAGMRMRIEAMNSLEYRVLIG
jgi:hypothetical protein